MFNVRKFLPRCVASLLAQTYENLEIIFVDDCSTDGSREFLEENIKKFKNAKLLFHSENKNLFLTRLSAMKACTGEYVICLDSDDYVDKNYYETLHSAMVSMNADFCVGDFSVDKDENLLNLMSPFEKECFLNKECLEKFFSHNSDQMICLWNKMLRKDLFHKFLEDVERYAQNAEGINCCEDCLFLFMMLYHAKKMIQVFGPKYHYVQHKNQSICISDNTILQIQLNSLYKVSTKLTQFICDKNLTEKYFESIQGKMLYVLRSLKYYTYKNSIQIDDDLREMLRAASLRNIMEAAKGGERWFL